jgi:hypothetical protein
MEGTARAALHIADTVPRARIAASYSGKKPASSFWEAKKTAAELNGSLISAKRMVNLFKVASTLSSSDSTLLKEFEGGIRVNSPNFSWFFEGVSRKELASLVEGAGPAWVDALLLLGPFPEQVSRFGPEENRTVLELPKHLVNLNDIMLLDSGSFTDERGSKEKRVLVADNAEPVLLGERSGGTTLHLDEKGNFTHSSEHSKRKTDPMVPVFIHTQAERVSRLVCAITSTPSEGGVGGSKSLIIRLAALNEHERMGAIIEMPMD